MVWCGVEGCGEVRGSVVVWCGVVGDGVVVWCGEGVVRCDNGCIVGCSS